MSTALASSLTTSSDSGRLRRRYWVLPKLQMRMIMWLVLVTSLLATIAAWVVLMAVWTPLGAHLVIAEPDVNVEKLFADACIRVFATTGLMVLVFAVIAYMVGLVVSHRIAGPLYRLSQAARRITHGQIPQHVSLRQGDYIKDFAEDFNEMTKALDYRMRSQEHALKELRIQLDTLERKRHEGELSPEELGTELRGALRSIDDAFLTETQICRL